MTSHLLFPGLCCWCPVFWTRLSTSEPTVFLWPWPCFPAACVLTLGGPGLPLSDPGSVLTPWLQYRGSSGSRCKGRKMCVISTTFVHFLFIIILAKSLQTLSFFKPRLVSLFMDANSWGRFPPSAHFLLCHSSFFTVFPQRFSAWRLCLGKATVGLVGGGGLLLFVNTFCWRISEFPLTA